MDQTVTAKRPSPILQKSKLFIVMLNMRNQAGPETLVREEEVIQLDEVGSLTSDFHLQVEKVMMVLPAS